MPIRFFCEHCRQMLKIGTSKSGSRIDCPRCRKALIVPQQSAPQADELYQMLKSKRVTALPLAAELPAGESIEENQDEDLSLSEPIVPESAFDEFGNDLDEADLNRWLDELWSKNPPKVPAGQQSPVLKPTESTKPLCEKTTGEIALLALKKQYKLAVTMIYVSASIALLIGIALGLFLGSRVHQPVHPVHTVPSSTGINEIVGTLIYINEFNERHADTDAVVFGLPMDRLPSPLLSCKGLWPDDPENHDTVNLILELGGMYGRTDMKGKFSLPYQEDKQYLIVKMSANKLQPDGELSPSVLQELRRYFRDPELLGGHALHIDEFIGTGGRYSMTFTF